MKRFVFILGFAAFILLIGCRSRVIMVKLINDSAQPVSTIIVDYPGGTFGDNALLPGKTFLYRLKALDNGPLKVQFTNIQGVTHTVAGPSLRKNQEGSLEINFTQDSATMHPDLH
ncbi:MAG TPA: hypothetical protein VKW06_06450 [Candidatus Angelobacter sp.]|nr:hypothetical protein [Candidatus Angelobacter sp.]